jgi:HK97 family phage portal protein
MENPYAHAAIQLTSRAIAQIPARLYRISESEEVEKALEMAPRSTGRHEERRAAVMRIWEEKMKSYREHTEVKPVAKHYAKKELIRSGVIEPVENHEIYGLLRTPNEYTQRSYQDLMIALTSYLEIGGMVLLEPVRGASSTDSVISSLKVHQPRELQIEREGGRPIGEIRVSDESGNDKDFTYRPDPTESEVFYERYFHPMYPRFGLSPVEPAAHSVDINNQAREWNLNLLFNGAQPSGVLSTDKQLGDARRQKLKRQWREKHTGPQNAGSVVVADGGGGAKFQPTSMSPQDMQWGDLTRLSAREVAVVWNVPAQLIGHTESQTYCLPGESSIATPSGRKRIENLSAGNKVYSYDTENQTIEESTVVWKGQTGVKQTYKVEGRGFEFEATANHPVLVMSKEAEDNPGGGGIKYVPKYEYKPVRELECGDSIVKAFDFPDGEMPASRVPTMQEMEFLGAMIGDGCLTEDGSGRVDMSGLKGERRDAYERALRALTPNKVRERERGIVVSDMELNSRLKELGFGGKAKEKRIPGWVFEAPSIHRRAFLRGLFDTDGTVDEDGHVTFAVANMPLAKDVRRLCLSLGVQVTVAREGTRMTTLPDGNEVENYLARITATVAEQNVLVGSRDLERSSRLLKGATTHTKGRRMANANGKYVKERMRQAHENGVEFCSVTDITAVGERPVYDIEVEGKHNFFAEGVVVHNSNYRSARRSFYVEKVIPLVTKLFGFLNSTVIANYDDPLLLDYETASIDALKKEINEMHERAREDVQNTLLTPNEARSKIGEQEVEGGDVLLMPKNMIPLTAAPQDREDLDEGALEPMDVEGEPKGGDPKTGFTFDPVEQMPMFENGEGGDA